MTSAPDPPRLVPCAVILPAYNEQGAVGAQVEAIRRVLSARGIEHEIIVVDDGSTDQTAAEALRVGARVVVHHENRGYGAAIKTGILAATYETLVICDADGTYPADKIPVLLRLLQDADMVVGARTGKEVAIPFARRPAKWLLRWLAAYIAQQPIPDLNSGLRAFRKACVGQYFAILSDRFSFTTTVTLALLSDGYRVLYHQIDYYPRIGNSKITPWHFMDFASLILRMSMMFRPLKVFGPLAVFVGALGILKVIFDVAVAFFRHGAADLSLLSLPTLSTSAILLLMLAVQLLLIGMMADGVIRRIALHTEPLVASRGTMLVESLPALRDSMPQDDRADPIRRLSEEGSALDGRQAG